MAFLNRFSCIGYLTKDAELRYTQKGTPVVTFRVAVTTPTKKGDGETLFINVAGFGREKLAEYLKKGKRVYLEGRLRYREWEDENGNRRSDYNVLLQNVQFIDSVIETSESSPDVEPPDDEDIPF